MYNYTEFYVQLYSYIVLGNYNFSMSFPPEHHQEKYSSLNFSVLNTT